MKQDKRVKRDILPINTFLVAFFVFGLLTTIQMRILGHYIDYRSLKPAHIIAIFALWLFVAASFTIITNYQIRKHYQEPIEKIADGAKKVTDGDFSVYIAPRHTEDKYDYLDVLFVDFNKMVAELGSTETLKSDFISNVSHEIKTPLAIIYNNAELLGREGISEEQKKECTQTILSASHRLSDLIQNILKLNKLEKQVIAPQSVQYDLTAQICDCAMQFENLWEEKNIDFEIDAEERVLIRSDSGLLALVWTNLLSNALKFTENGGHIKLSQKPEKDIVTISVADSGCGMRKETIQHIFDKFYQGDTSHATQGNGLGLALVLRILQLLGGTISVQSEVGKGSVFSVVLPLGNKEQN